MNTSVTAPKLLSLVTREFQGKPMWAVDHPEHGELLMAKHVLKALGYSFGTNEKKRSTSAILRNLGFDRDRVIQIKKTELDERCLSNVPNEHTSAFPNRGAGFLDRRTVRQVALVCTLPPARAFRDWLADVSLKVEDTGGYLLNEASRDTAFADTRTSVPLPAAIAGGYSALIEARQAELKAREGELAALYKAAEERRAAQSTPAM